MEDKREGEKLSRPCIHSHIAKKWGALKRERKRERGRERERERELEVVKV